MPSRAVGLCFARQHVGIVRLRRSAARWQLEAFTEQELPTPLFDSAATPALMDGLHRSLAELTAGLAASYVPVHISLPDPLVRAAVFELEELPRSPVAQTSLVGFRFSRELAAEAALVSVSQSLGQARAQLLARATSTQLLFGMSIDSSWHETLQQILRQLGVVAWGIAPDTLQRFNLFHDRLAAGSGALLNASADSWTLALWDEQGRLRYCGAHWREPGSAATGGDHQIIAGEVARVIVAYADAQPERSIQNVFVAAATETEAIASTLDRRASSPCIRLSVVELVVGCDEQLLASRTGERALSAALSL